MNKTRPVNTITLQIKDSMINQGSLTRAEGSIFPIGACWFAAIAANLLIKASSVKSEIIREAIAIGQRRRREVARSTGMTASARFQIKAIPKSPKKYLKLLR